MVFLKRILTLVVAAFIFLTGCFSHNIGNKFEDPAGAYLKAFVSLNTVTTINMTPLAGAYISCNGLIGYSASTCYCTEEAKVNGIYNGRDFRAWFSTASVDARCNILGQEVNTEDCDITILDSDGYGPWLEPGSYKVIFKSHTDMLQNSLTNTFQMQADGINANPGAVLTDTNQSGYYSGGGCNGDPTVVAPSTMHMGIAGNNTYWTNDQLGYGCATTGRVYCFEVPDL